MISANRSKELNEASTSRGNQLCNDCHKCYDWIPHHVNTQISCVGFIAVMCKNLIHTIILKKKDILFKSKVFKVDKLTYELERSRELGRVIVHVDMDAFYAAVEMRDCPELKDKPMAVGSMSMLSTSNYHASRFGVRAAMPGFIAKNLCPNLVIVPTNFDKYRAVSAQVREIFSEYDPHFMPMSLDEAYLDITEQRKHWPETMRTYCICDASAGVFKLGSGKVSESEKDERSPVLFEESPSSSPSLSGADRKAEVFGTSAEEAVREMRFRIQQKTSLTASAGIAPNMMLAKVCSDKNKPNGQYRIPPERQAVMEFIQDLPVRKVSGLGKVTEKMVAALGIVNCDQLGQQIALLSLLFREPPDSWVYILHLILLPKFLSIFFYISVCVCVCVYVYHINKDTFI
uniref:DNA polymerase kappa n=1 Tax=Sinocyclocheilus rhinocerous TaxID=307959 RepID=A0A673GV15_9TELE